MTADQIREAEARLAEAERKCRSVPIWLPPVLYKRRLDAAMREWKQANLALFDAQVSAMDFTIPGKD